MLGSKRPQTFFKKPLDKSPKVWYNNYSEVREMNKVINVMVGLAVALYVFAMIMGNM